MKMALSINGMGIWGANGDMKGCRWARKTSAIINHSSYKYSEIQDIGMDDNNPKCV